TPPRAPTREPTTAEHRAIAARRKRHRDLPAKVRRRQAIALGVIVLLVAFGLYKVISGIFGSDDKKGGSTQQVPVEKLIGQTVVAKLPSSGPDEALLKRVSEGQIGGVLVNPKSAKALTTDTAKLQAAAKAGGNPPLMIAIDQEGGPVKRLPGPPKQSPAQIGESGDEDRASSEGKDTGTYLAGLGVNVDFAPVADVAHPGAAKTLSTRTFGSDPAEVAKLVTAFAGGLRDGGTAATVKHFPGLGFAKNNTDVGIAKIAQTRDELEPDLEPFKSAIEGGVGLVMTSTATYGAFDAKNPAALSPTIINTELRDNLGFDGVVISDDLEGAAVTKQLPSDQAALASLAAGGDMVVFAKTTGASANAYKSLVKAATKGQLTRESLEASYKRILDLKDGFGA
nr:glycoside hydrolase family 3 protein [Solirubrobacterales bacterium]